MAMWQAFLDGLSILNQEWLVILGSVGVVCLGCSLNFFLSKNSFREKTNSRRSVFLLAVYFAVSVLLRLAFLKGVFVPPYFDSVEHYRITKHLLAALEASTVLETLPTLTPGYYHLGFHFLASLLAFILRADPLDVILVLGQVILAAIPLPVFFLLRHETQSEASAFFGMLLVGFGWYMPGFAVNWGKYPALAGLLVLEIALVFIYNLSEKYSSSRPRRREQIILICCLLLGMLISTLFHTRTLIIFLITIACWLIAGRISTLQKTCQYLFLGTSLAGILILGKFIQGEPLLNLALDPYLSSGIWVTLTILALSPFALVKFAKGMYSSLLFLLCVFAALFIPVGIRSPGLENQTLLDRPFVEMALYLPLSILGGLGLAGFLQTLATVNVLPEKTRFPARILSTILLIGFTGLMSIGSYDFYPSDCCSFVGYDDTLALDWMDKNLPPGARILVAATQLQVLPAGAFANLTGTDAGIWIPALTGRKISLEPFENDFRSASTFELMCQKRIQYIYVGGTDQGFNIAQLKRKTKWYEQILFLPEAQLYQLTRCLR